MNCIFIGGYLRTGTTLVQTLLCSSPKTNPMIGEAVYLGDLLEAYHRSLKFFDEHSKDYFENTDELTAHCARTIEEHLQHVHQRLDCPEFLVLKRPQLTPQLTLLHRMRPKDKIIVMVRDPRDVVASAVQGIQRGAKEFGSQDIKRIAMSMRFYTQSCSQTQLKGFRAQCCFLRYEDLVQHPLQALQLLEEFTEIPLDGPALTSGAEIGQVDYGSAEDKTQPLHSPLYGQAISNKRIGNYTSVLTPQQTLIVEKICAPIMETFDYTPSEAGPSASC